jgi:hypothetical protein
MVGWWSLISNAQIPTHRRSGCVKGKNGSQFQFVYRMSKPAASCSTFDRGRDMPYGGDELGTRRDRRPWRLGDPSPAPTGHRQQAMARQLVRFALPPFQKPIWAMRAMGDGPPPSPSQLNQLPVASCSCQLHGGWWLPSCVLLPTTGPACGFFFCKWPAAKKINRQKRTASLQPSGVLRAARRNATCH